MKYTIKYDSKKIVFECSEEDKDKRDTIKKVYSKFAELRDSKKYKKIGVHENDREEPSLYHYAKSI